MRATLVLVALAGLCLLVPGRALAGSYTVRSCQAQSGGAANWTPEADPDPGYVFADGCGESGAGMSIALSGTVADKTTAARTFTAPAGTRIRQLTSRFRAHSETIGVVLRLDVGFANSTFTTLAQTACSPGCPGDAGSATADQTFPFKTDPAARNLTARVFCVNGAPCNGGAATQLQIFRAVIDLDDLTDPTVDADATRGLWRGGEQPRGTLEVATTATDTGSGIADVTLQVDGVQVAKAQNSCSDAKASPCSLSFTPVLNADTSKLAAGTHTATLVATDYSGNVAPAKTLSFTITDPAIGTPGSDNGTGATATAKLVAGFGAKARHVKTVAYGKSATVSGRLTNAQTSGPIAGARLVVETRVNRGGARYTSASPLTTDGDGYFTLRIPAGPSRDVRLGYANRVGATAVTQATVRLAARARPTLALHPARIRPRGLLQFSGHLIGGYIPSSGTLVEIQAYSAGRWRAVTTVRARAKGRFRGSYRFGAGTGAYRVRARVPVQSGYPFARGDSPVRVLHVR